jgi:hypothetical protein
LASFNKINSFVEAVAEKVHNLGSDTLHIALSNTALSAGMTQLSDVTQIAAGNGYTTGGKQATISASAQTGGTYKLTLADLVFTASGGSMAEFQYIVLYNNTASNDELIGWWDRGSGLTLADTETFTVDFSDADGVLQIA